MSTGKKITHEEYVQKVAEVNPNIEVVGEYIKWLTVSKKYKEGD